MLRKFQVTEKISLLQQQTYFENKDDGVEGKKFPRAKIFALGLKFIYVHLKQVSFLLSTGKKFPNRKQFY